VRHEVVARPTNPERITMTKLKIKAEPPRIRHSGELPVDEGTTFCATVPDSKYVILGRCGNDGELYAGRFHPAACLEMARLASWIEVVEGPEADELFDLLVAVQARDKDAWVAFIDKCNAWKSGGLEAAVEKQCPEAMEQAEQLELVGEFVQTQADKETKQ